MDAAMTDKYKLDAGLRLIGQRLSRQLGDAAPMTCFDDLLKKLEQAERKAHERSQPSNSREEPVC